MNEFMREDQLKELFRKYLDESLSREEFIQLYEMMRAGYDPATLDEILETTLTDPRYTVDAADYDKKEVFATLLARMEGDAAPVIGGEEGMPGKEDVVPMIGRRRVLDRIKLRSGVRRLIAVAAAAMVLLLAGNIYWITHKKKSSGDIAVDKNEVRFDAPPGKSGAILTLANGQQMELDNVQNGRLARQGDAQLVKEDGKLSYQAEGRKGSDVAGTAGSGAKGKGNAAGSESVQYNTITTPRGRQFELVLSDGTRVSLNAASTIRYPTSFTGKERRVEVSGEAYFEVARNEQAPFVVKTGGAEVVVLGTRMDVSNYPDENNISTTLVEGSVRVSQAAQQLLLSPGEQGRVDRTTGELSLKKVDVDQVVAWTKGRLAISNSDLPALMRQISRWYDVDIELPNTPPNVRIGGFLHRDVNLSTILEYLEENGVHYKTQGKTITILP